MPRPRKRALFLAANWFAQLAICGSRFSTCCMLPGSKRSSLVYCSSASEVTSPRIFPRVTASPNRATSWVVNALVEATPISAPARVYNTSSLSRGREDSITLHMDRLCCMPSDWAYLSASMVSRVSPDWEMVMISCSGSAITLR